MKWFDMESKFMKIEYLFPEITGIFGDHANVNILKKSIPNAEISYTSLNSRPLFLDEDINLVYMGSMTECNQKLVINRLNIFKKEIIQRINEGQNFIITGNALEIFGNGIKDVGKFVFKENGGPFVEGLGIFNFDTERDMINKYNSLWLGEYDGQKLTGLRSQFTRIYISKTSVIQKNCSASACNTNYAEYHKFKRRYIKNFPKLIVCKNYTQSYHSCKKISCIKSCYKT